MDSDLVTSPNRSSNQFRLTSPVPRRRTPVWLISVLCVALGGSAGTALRHQIAGRSATLRVEALISGGTTFRIYFNNDWGKPQDLPVRPNEWVQYLFTVPARVTALRFDLPDQAARAAVRSISVSNGGPAVTIPPVQLQSWIGAHMRASLQPDGTVLLTSDAPGGYLMSREDIQSGSSNRILEHLHLDATTLFWSFLVAAMVLLILSAEANLTSALFLVASFVAALWLGRFLILAMLRMQGTFPAVDSAVGAAAYGGLSVGNELHAVNMAIAAVPVFLASLCWLWLRKDPGLRTPFTIERTNVRIGAFLTVVLGCALFALPPASQYLANAGTIPHPATFDSQNIFTWEFLRFQGKLPWRDYWFPYGGFYDRLAPLYPDLLIEFLNDLLLIAIFAWFGLKVFGNRLWMMIGCCALFVFFQSAGVFWPGASPRYFLSFALVLIAAVTVQEASIRYFVALGAFFIYVISQEASQAIFAAPACALLIGAGIVFTSTKPGRLRLFKSFGMGTLTGAFGLAIYFEALYRNRQIAEWWTFISKLNDSAAYGAIAAPISEWVSLRSGLASGLLLLIALLLLGGVVHVIWPSDRRNVYTFLPLSLGILSWMMFQKQVIRPGIEAQIMPIPIFGAVLLLFQRVAGKPSRRIFGWLSFSVAALFCCFILDAGPWNNSLMPQLRRLRDIPSDLNAAFFSGNRWRTADQAYFAPALFQFTGLGPGSTNGAQVRDCLRAVAPTTSNEAVYVLGNDPLLYLLLQKQVPFYTNIYNESPIYSQQRTVHWLERYQPRYVFWDASVNEFDGVPNQIRVPLVYTYILERYRLTGTGENYQILQRLTPAEPPDLAYWTKMLGPTLDLGYIPATSKIADPGTGTGHADVLEFYLVAPRQGAEVSVPVIFGDKTLTISLRQVDNKRTYFVRLDRIPIIETARSAGLQIELGRPSAGARVRRRTIAVPVDDLY